MTASISAISYSDILRGIDGWLQVDCVSWCGDVSDGDLGLGRR